MREIEIALGLADKERMPARAHEGVPDGAAGARRRLVFGSRVQIRRAWRIGRRCATRSSSGCHRTPIQGSAPAQPDDDARDRSFIEGYFAVHARAVERGWRSHARSDSGKATCAARERARREVASARAYLLGEALPRRPARAIAHPRRARIHRELRELPLLAWPREVIDSMTAFKQSFVVFRQRHARMVERRIGRRTGTGSSAGVDYLDATAL